MIIFEDKPSTKTPINAKNLNSNFAEVVETGNGENGSWTKFADGTMIVRQRYWKAVSTNQPTGSLYWCRIDDANIPEFPEQFLFEPTVSIEGKHNDIISVMSWGNSVKKPCTTIYLYSAVTLIDTNVDFHIIAIGKWK